MSEIRGSDVNGKSIIAKISQPRQLNIFQSFQGAYPEDYGNSIDLYDAIPKIVPSAKEMDGMRRDGIFLPILERNFKHRGKEYKLKLSPARIQDSEGNEREFYPSHRDWMVEEALRKFACDQERGIFLDDGIGVRFSLSELRRELKEQGRGITFDSLIESLTVLSKAQMQICAKDSSVTLNSTIFSYTLLPNRSDWLADPTKRQCCVKFNPLVTASIDALTFRQFNYRTFMELRSSLSQWLHRRLSHNYTQADRNKPYTISLTTIVSDSGMVNNQRLADDAKQVRRALEELKSKNVLSEVAELSKSGKRNTLFDIVFTLIPSISFVNEMKVANRRATHLKSRHSDSLVEPKGRHSDSPG